MKDIKEKAEYCLHCKVKPCSKGCPLGNDIPEFIADVLSLFLSLLDSLCPTSKAVPA